MPHTLTYIHHNAFVLRTGNRSYLFDYPEEKHLPAGAGGLARRAVAGTELVVFISHGHEDHLHGNLASVTGSAARVRYVLSDDILEMRPEAIPDNGEVLVVEPGAAYEFGGMAIKTLMSNDLGVAFLVEDGDFRFYFGGDLAEWIWPGASPREAAFTGRFFREAMERVYAFGPMVAFSNVDKRLPGLAGGAEACRIIGAPVFVPMHSFGDTDWPLAFIEACRACGARLFLYDKPGDTLDF